MWFGYLVVYMILIFNWDDNVVWVPGGVVMTMPMVIEAIMCWFVLFKWIQL